MSSSEHSGYLPGLDGLRAVAIFGVLLTHDLPWTIAGHSNAVWKGLGGWGVQLFFAISGVLICWRLLEDEQQTGQISLRPFYIRRLFRIQPAALSYLVVVALLFASGVMNPNWHYWRAAAFAYINFVVTEVTPPSAAALLGHFWTLAVEEHFYILLSLFLFSFRKRRLLLLCLFLFLLFAAQNYGVSHGGFAGQDSARRTYWIIQFLLVPALLALIIRLPHLSSAATIYFKPWVALLLTAAMMVANQASQNTNVLTAGWAPFSFYQFLLDNRNPLFYGFGLAVIAIMLNPQSFTTRFLELPALRFLGRLSYSIYLWHILFFIPVYLGNLFHSPILTALSARPWKYIATLTAALLSYHLIEKPFIRLGHRLAPSANDQRRGLVASGHPD